LPRATAVSGRFFGRHYLRGGALQGLAGQAHEWLTAHKARMVGEPAQRPRMPFIIAADGPRGLQLVYELGDGGVTLGRQTDSLDAQWQGVAELSARLDETLASAGRAQQSLDRYLSLDASPQFSLESVDSFADAVGRATELGFTDVITHWPRPDGVCAGREEVLIEAASRFRRSERAVNPP